MFGRLSVAVVIPALNEAQKLPRTIRSVPSYVDRIIIVDDGSNDATAARAMAAAAQRRGVEVVRHERNFGVGRAIASGYARALELGCGAVAVMAGDAQMDPADLDALLVPLEAGTTDYAKGNRFLWPRVCRIMPPTRLIGNFVLSWLTRLACGWWRGFDSQCGYTAITRNALALLDPDQIFPRYGYPNDILARLCAHGARIADVPVRPVYGPGWRSGVRPWMVIYPISFLLARALARRIARRLTGSRSTRTDRALPAAALARHQRLEQAPPAAGRRAASG